MLLKFSYLLLKDLSSLNCFQLCLFKNANFLLQYPDNQTVDKVNIHV